MHTSMIDTSAEVRIAHALAAGAAPEAGTAPERRRPGDGATRPTMAELGNRWHAVRQKQVALELRVRGAAVQAEELDSEDYALRQQMELRPAACFAEVAQLLDVAIEMDMVEVQPLPADRRLLDHLLAELARLAPTAKLGALDRLTALGDIRLLDPAAVDSGAPPDELAPCAAADAGARIAELWRSWAMLQREETLLLQKEWRRSLCAGDAARLEAIDGAMMELRRAMCAAPVRDMADVAGLLDAALALDLEANHHPGDRGTLEHLVKCLAALAPEIEMDTLRQQALLRAASLGADSAALAAE